MNRKLISKAISDMEDSLIAESMFPPVAKDGQPSERTENMKGNSVKSRRVIGIILAACLVFTLAVTAYAADIGGIRRLIQIWLYGEQTTAVLEVQNGQYTLTDEEGSFIRGGGGVAIEPDGSERPLTEEEILEHLDQPELYHKEDGTIWVYYRGQKIEITDRFDADGYCYLELRNGTEILYATIERNGGMSTSPEKYVQPHQFGTTQEP